jgi:NDP-sugar pyrophosphorylase family protein/aminoglycoside/choline kinase family phosphotransferase
VSGITYNTLKKRKFLMKGVNLINVFIPAAGLGERLRPITDLISKPLLPVLGKAILQIILEKMTTLPVCKIAINLHYKRERLKQWLINSDFNTMIEIFPEDPILGTGGALKNAETLLKESVFLVHNSDIVSDIDLKTLLDRHLSSQNLVTLAVHDYPEFNKLEIDENGFLMSFSPSLGGKRLGGGGTKSKRFVAFTGIAAYSPEFLRFLPPGISSVVDAWTKALYEGCKIGTFDVSGYYWRDIGTPASYAQAVIEELRRQGETVYIDSSFEGCKNVELDGFVVIEKGCIVDKDVSLRNCILLPGSTSPHPPLTKGGMGGSGHLFKQRREGWIFENCIIGPKFKIDLKESDILSASLENNKFLIGTGGSDRKYFRVKSNGKTVVLMKCNDEDRDFSRHIEYTRFFRRYSIPVPELIEADQQNMSAIFEDLGDLSLYNWLKCQREKKQIEEVYRQVIEILILIHTVATEHVSECPILHNRLFDYNHLRWETAYFIERFVKGIGNTDVKDLSALNSEFHRLALKVNSFPKTIIHRDFQSQNIMIAKRGTPRILDYQGARIGPPAYDVVSILWDPYYRLEDDLRERLIEYYIGKMYEGGFFDKIEFKETLLPCRLQRHMQALGAYGFLSSVKGKKYFLKYVPEGIRLLKEDVSLSKDEYPALHNLITVIF